MTPMKNNPNLKVKKETNGFRTRMISAAVMLVLLTFYISSSIIYTEGSRNKLDNAAIASYFTLSLSSIIIALAIYEGALALGIKKWYSFAILIFLAILLYFFPVTRENQKELADATYAFLDHINIFSWYHWYIPIILICSITIIIGIVMMTLPVKTMKSTLLMLVIFFVVVFGFKGFTNISLLITTKGTPYYSFTTIIWIWMIVILTDSFAYLGGMKFGKTKMAPTISPKKTWEGALIGLSMAVIIGTIFAILLFTLNKTSQWAPMTIDMNKISAKHGQVVVYLMYLVIGILISIIGQFGDLLFSFIKRSVGIKDYSNLIPGHGGILDRLDSFLLAFFVMFFITLI